MSASDRSLPAAHARWRGTLHALSGAPEPLFVFDDDATPAASIWTGARAYVRAFREAGLEPGDRIVLGLPPSVAFVQALVAALWEGLTLVPAPPSEAATLLDTVDASAAVLAADAGPSGHAWVPDDVGGPLGIPQRRSTRHDATPDARFLLRTSGTTGAPTWVALSDAGVWSVLDSHREPLALDGGRVLSVLPWHHAFGLILDLLPALLWADELVRDTQSGRDPGALIDLASASESTHLSCVPLTLRRLVGQPGGEDLLARLRGGVVGGAPLAADHAQAMRGTSLRVGYGQTEASPGIALGRPGHAEPGLLGRELGCHVRTEADGVLSFRGANAALGIWTAGEGLTRLDPDRWVRTQDRVERRGGDLYFRGRAGDAFKLDNGRFVRAGEVEATLRDLPGVLDAVVSTPDGTALALDLLTDGRPPVRARVADALGPHARRLGAIRPHTASAWPMLAKGTPDRSSLLQISPLTPAMTTPHLTLGPDRPLDVRRLERTAREASPSVALSDAAQTGMRRSKAALDTVIRRGDAVYGLTTGFGPHVAHGATGDAIGSNLTAHLAAGWGAPASAEVARATVLVRAQQIAQGHSGVAPEVVEAYLAVLHAGLVPYVPCIGSVGASGDLTPLAHVARLLTGEGWALDPAAGDRVPAREALAAVGLEPLPLSGREALGLVNGTAFMTATLALAVARAERLLSRTERLVGWAYRMLGCRRAALDARLHDARGHAGQARSAAAIRAEIERGTETEDRSRPLQEVYVLRCAPQILGACRDSLAFARQTVETEMNGVSDNPVVVADPRPEALHGGNFQGQQIAFAADTLNAAIVQTAVFAERLLDALTDPKRGVVEAPLLLAYEPGPTSGLAGAQMTATALVAEMRHHAQMASTSSIPTNAGNQDIVSMGTLAARTALGQAERLAPVLATVGIALAQLSFLRAEGRAPGSRVPLPMWMPPFEGLRADRPLFDDIARVAAIWEAPYDASRTVPTVRSAARSVGGDGASSSGLVPVVMNEAWDPWSAHRELMRQAVRVG